jgi:hypothetical protein
MGTAGESGRLLETWGRLILIWGQRRHRARDRCHPSVVGRQSNPSQVRSWAEEMTSQQLLLIFLPRASDMRPPRYLSCSHDPTIDCWASLSGVEGMVCRLAVVLGTKVQGWDLKDLILLPHGLILQRQQPCLVSPFPLLQVGRRSLAFLALDGEQLCRSMLMLNPLKRGTLSIPAPSSPLLHTYILYVDLAIQGQECAGSSLTWWHHRH